ncbi:hypothetical protein B566_EDAN004940 [Ephemera danica]|nr:hypothetical protein B566_EDAN004940 [Ephemera danica]
MIAKSAVFLLVVASTAVYGSERIFEGTEVADGEIPFMVSIQDRDGIHQCGGVIIGATEVITSYACMNTFNSAQAVVRSSSVSLSGGVTRRIRNILPHPDFVPVNGTIFENDIAILTVIPNQIVPPDTNLTVAGWGTTSFGGGGTTVLLKSTATTMDEIKCANAFADLFTLPDNVICSTATACERDEGGPMFNGNIVFGLYSYGGACGETGRPNVYTDVAAFSTWILQNVPPMK